MPHTEATSGATTQVVELELDRARALVVRFADDVVATIPLIDLRQACPCASCRNRRDAGSLPYRGTEITAIDAELHGNWGIAIRWSDGHDTGIYSWSILRTWCDADRTAR